MLATTQEKMSGSECKIKQKDSVKTASEKSGVIPTLW